MRQCPILYHGTDARIVRMGEEKRKQHKEYCDLAIDYMWPYYEQFSVGCFRDNLLMTLLENDSRLFSDVKASLRSIRLMRDGHSQFQYQNDSLYLTCNKELARAFAKQSFAFGEKGFFAYTLIKVAPIMAFKEWNPKGEIADAINTIETFAKGIAEPVIFEFSNLELGNMVDDHDMPVKLPDSDEDFIIPCVFRVVRYTKPIVLDLNKSIPVH